MVTERECATIAHGEPRLQSLVGFLARTLEEEEGRADADRGGGFTSMDTIVHMDIYGFGVGEGNFSLNWKGSAKWRTDTRPRTRNA